MPAAPDHLGIYFAAVVAACWLVGGTLFWWLRRRALQQLDRLGEASSEEMLDELEREWHPSPGLTIRTQAEYLPFLVESIREVIDRGLADDQVICLQERFEHSRPNEVRRATFTVEVGGRPESLDIEWYRDDADRIELRVRCAPAVIHALEVHRRRVPRSRRTLAKG